MSYQDDLAIVREHLNHDGVVFERAALSRIEAELAQVKAERDLGAVNLLREFVVKCGECGGHGKRRVYYGGPGDGVDLPCPSCNGSGRASPEETAEVVRELVKFVRRFAATDYQPHRVLDARDDARSLLSRLQEEDK